MNILDTHYEELRNYARKIARQNNIPDEGEDVFHEVFIEFERKGTLRGKSEVEQLKMMKAAIYLNCTKNTSNYIYTHHKHRYFKATKVEIPVNLKNELSTENEEYRAVEAELKITERLDELGINGVGRELINWKLKGRSLEDYPNLSIKEATRIYNKTVAEMQDKRQLTLFEFG